MSQPMVDEAKTESEVARYPECFPLVDKQLFGGFLFRRRLPCSLPVGHAFPKKACLISFGDILLRLLVNALLSILLPQGPLAQWG